MAESGIGPLAVLIRRRRLELGLSLGELARRASVDKSLLSLTERGLHSGMKAETLKAIGRALEMPVADLLTAADYLPSNELPTLKPYMRARFADLSDAALEQVERFVADLQRRQHPSLSEENEVDERRSK